MTIFIMIYETSFHPYSKHIIPADFPKGNENVGFSFYVVTFDKEFVYVIQGTDTLFKILSK